MTKMEAIVAIKEVMQKAQGAGIIVVAVVGHEEDTNVRLLHTLATDEMCGRLLRQVAGPETAGN